MSNNPFSLDVNPPNCKINVGSVTNGFFQQWLVQPATRPLIDQLFDLLRQNPSKLIEDALEPQQTSFQSPPRSPTRAPPITSPTPLSPSVRRSFGPGVASPALVPRPRIDPVTESLRREAASYPPLDHVFGPSRPHLERLRRTILVEVGNASIITLTTRLMRTCGLPAFLLPLAYSQISGADPRAPPPPTLEVDRPAFDTWLSAVVLSTDDAGKRIYSLLQQRSPQDPPYEQHERGLTYSMLHRAAEVLARNHPALTFLAASKMFQDYYIETVVIRMLFRANAVAAGAEVITPRMWRQGGLGEAFSFVDVNDISAEVRVFSYEHFYVIYSTYHALCGQHNLIMSKDDLAKYNRYTLSCRVVDRVYSRIGMGCGGVLGPRRRAQGSTWAFEDFCWFMLCEEDKDAPAAISYWFNILDLDGDGVISPSEVAFWWKEMNERLRRISSEAVVATPIIQTQLHDMVAPSETDPGISLVDIQRCKVPGNVINVLTNLNKYMAFDNRDPYVSRGNPAPPCHYQLFMEDEYAAFSAK